MKSIIYCISDAHLAVKNSKIEEKKEKKLKLFLNRIRDEGADLIINGDFFDFYFEYNSVIPRRYFGILAKLKEIVDSGVVVRFVAGNHDFWVGDFFEKDLGIKVFRKSLKLRFYDKKIFIAHGDGLGRFDVGHLLLQILLRQPINISLFSLLHPDIAYTLGRWVSKMSRKKSSNNKRFSLSGHPLRKFARDLWDKGYDAVILGHIHYPYLEKEGDKVFAIIGDWIDKFSYIRISRENISLHYFKG
jgi:UDP-2,3-diacylglucosamine hydrolase